MADTEDVIVDVPDISESETLIQEVNEEVSENENEKVVVKKEINDSKDVPEKVNETLTTIEEADEIVDKAINDAVDNIVAEANDQVEEIKNENAKLAAGIAMSVVNEVTKNKEELIDKTTDKVFESLLKQAESVGVKKSTIAILIKYVMEAVEDTPLKGAEQKDYALRLIRSLVVELADDEDKEYLLIAIDSGSVSDTIDLVVAASRGELNVNMIVETAATSCLPCITSVLAKRCKKN